LSAGTGSSAEASAATPSDAATRDPVGLLADDEACFAVRLEVRQAVDDVRAHRLERARPADVGGVVEASLELDEHRDLLPVLGGLGQRHRDRRRGADAVERHLDREHLRVDGRLLDEPRDRVERLIRVLHQHVSGADRRPHVHRGFELGHRTRRTRRVLEEGRVHGPVELEEVGERREARARVEVVRGSGPDPSVVSRGSL
jgi:hypothetical protein